MADKHTPGPWIVVYQPTGTGNSQWRVNDKDYNPITSSDVGPHAFNEANARLITAAPTMYGLLVELYNAKLGPDTLRILQPWFAKVGPIIEAAKGDA